MEEEQQKTVKPTGNDFSPERKEPDFSSLPEVKGPEKDPKRKPRKIIIILLVILILIGVAVAYFVFYKSSNGSSADTNGDQQNLEEQVSDSDPDTINILATGDWIAHDSVNEQAQVENGQYDYSRFTTAWEPLFEKTDINFCNQATLAAGEEFGITGYPVFNAPTEWIDDMANLGCNLINTGTNHTNDKGQAPINAQLDHWDTKNDILAITGSNRDADEQKEVKYFEVKGVKFAFLSYSTYSNSPNPNPYSLNRFDPTLYQAQTAEANKNADIVIASMRWGTEYSSGVNEQQKADAQILSDLGVDIILGHGPHYLEPVEKLKGAEGNDTVVWYSLGNFLNTQIETEALTGCVASIEIDVALKSIKSNSCLPFYMHYEWTAEQAAAEELLARSNLQIVPLDTAAELMAKSQIGTTVEAQTERISGVINSLTTTPIIPSSDY